jgi:hypothetical protein
LQAEVDKFRDELETWKSRWWSGHLGAEGNNDEGSNELETQTATVKW